MSSGPFELAPELAPGVPADYYRRIVEAEQAHFFHRGVQRSLPHFSAHA